MKLFLLSFCCICLYCKAQLEVYSQVFFFDNNSAVNETELMEELQALGLSGHIRFMYEITDPPTTTVIPDTTSVLVTSQQVINNVQSPVNGFISVFIVIIIGGVSLIIVIVFLSCTYCKCMRRATDNNNLGVGVLPIPIRQHSHLHNANIQSSFYYDH